MPGINFQFIMCIGIIRNNSLVGGRTRAKSNSGHSASYALLHMDAECVNHSATRASDGVGHFECKFYVDEDVVCNPSMDC